MKNIFLCSFLLVFTIVNSQNTSFQKEKYIWPDAKPSLLKQTNEFVSEDIVVVDEDVRLNLLDGTTQILNKNCILKINTEKGVQKFKSISLPESFDIGSDKCLDQQGRKSFIQAPYMYDFKIIHFAARVLKKSGEVLDLTANIKSNKVFWLESNGQKFEGFNYIFSFENIEPGDVVEYNYEIDFKGKYGGNLFFFNGAVPKQNSTLQVKYSVTKQYGDEQIIYSGNGADSALTKSRVTEETEVISIYSYNFKNLESVNYPVNSCSGKTLPYVYVDLNFVSFIIGMRGISNIGIAHKNRGPNFEWFYTKTLAGPEVELYDKQHASIRKFLSAIPKDESNPDNTAFLTKLSDTLNTLKYVAAEAMNSGENAQYSVSSGEWLLKGKLIEEFLDKIYWQLLTEAKIPKNIICVEDKRLGEHRTDTRTTYKYEYNLLGINNGKSILYMMPRINGIKYYLDEIPFYIEGTTAALMNHDANGGLGVVNFIRTSSSTEDENVRTENGMLRINLDSNIVNVSIKENLNGQFSTIARHAYLNETIDSTINPVYFKKCTDKPNAKNISIKKTFASNKFPFKSSFTCSEKIEYSNALEVPLKNWFSFTFNKQLIPERPNFDFYFDFQYSDTYNYMIQFNKPAEILNVNDFIKSIHNTNFELSSSLIKQSETTYLLNIVVKVKDPILSKADGQMLVDLTNELEGLNNLSLIIKK
ncbi:MAG: hypothetical protein ACXVPU_01845 [Bacteroidia bacterium]